MARYLDVSLFILCVLSIFNLYAANDVNFDGVTSNQSLGQPYINGDFTFDQDVAGSAQFLGTAAGGAITNDDAFQNSNTITFKATDGSEFRLVSFQIEVAGGDDIYTVAAYRDSGLIGSEIFDLSGVLNYQTFTPSGSDFNNIDEIRIINNENNNGYILINLDNLDVDTAILPNVAPVIANLNGDSFSFTEDGNAHILDQGTAATLSDSDSSDFNAGNLTVTITSGEDAAEDVLSINTSGAVALAGSTAGSNVSVSGTAIGTLGNNIAAGNDFVINLNSQATSANVQTAIQAITYQNTDTSAPTSGARNVRITVNDGDGGTTSNQDITVTVLSSNDEPTLTATASDPTFTEGGSAVGLFSSTSASTIEAGQTFIALTMTITNVNDASDEIITIDGSNVALTHGNSGTTATNSLSFSVSVSATTATLLITGGTLSSTALQNMVDGLSYQNNSNNPNTSDRVVTITSLQDSGGTTNSGDDTTSLTLASTVTVNALNNAPVFTESSPQTLTLNEDGPSAITLNATDTDNDTLTWSILSQASQGLASVSGTGSSKNVSYTPNANYNGADSFIVQISDGNGGSDTLTVNVTVNALNDAPSFNQSSPQALGVNEDSGGSITLNASDIESDTLTWSILSQASQGLASVSGTGSSKNVSYTPNANYNGADSFIVQISDGNGGSDSLRVNVTVNEVNDPPSGRVVITGEAIEGQTLIAKNTLNDRDGLGTISYTWQRTGVSVGSGNTYTITAADVGFRLVVVAAYTDQNGNPETVSSAQTELISRLNRAPIAENRLYQAEAGKPIPITLIANDADGDPLTFLLVSEPNFGVLSGNGASLTYTANSTFIGIDSFRFKTNDGIDDSNIATVEISVSAPNQAPIALEQTLSVAEDEPLQITLSGTDAEQSLLTFELRNLPQHGTLSGRLPNLIYQPEKDFNGEDRFTFIASDQSLDSAPATIQINVSAVNDAPLALNDAVTLERWESTDIDVLSNDTDIDGDPLVIVGAVVDSGFVTWTEQTIKYTPESGFNGQTMIHYTIADGGQTRASANVLVSVNVSDTAQPVITVPQDIELNATGLFTKVDLGVASAVDQFGNALFVGLVDANPYYPSGLHSVIWQASDDAGNTAKKTQQVKIFPLISFDMDQEVVVGQTVVVGVNLNGQAPAYPFSVPYTVAGNALFGIDHDLEDGIVTFYEGTRAELAFNTYAVASEQDKTLEIELMDTVNFGSKFSHQVYLKQNGVQPVLTLSVLQNNQPHLIVNASAGKVVISSKLSNVIDESELKYDWQYSGTFEGDLDSDDKSYTFDPKNLPAGRYSMQLNVSDEKNRFIPISSRVTFVIESSPTELSENDTDNDGVADNIEGIADDDQDGIVNYLDNINACNVLPHNGESNAANLIETELGVCLRIGDDALLAKATGALIDIESELTAEDYLNVGGVFDFIVTEMTNVGNHIRIVIPQTHPVPQNAVYRKFVSDLGWRDFIFTQGDSISSSLGAQGYCPPPGDESWVAGLIEGHWCVQLTIKDGGPNDADNTENGMVVDPGGIFVINDGNAFPIAQDDEVEARVNSEVIIDALANDSDPNGDTLTISAANADSGAVMIVDNQLHYTPLLDFIGTTEIIYTIEDGRGGSDFAVITMNLIENQAPMAVDDSLAVYVNQSRDIDVLNNDSDPEKDSLNVIDASASRGTVVINQNNTITYTAPTEAGIDTIVYYIRDSFGDTDEGRVKVAISDELVIEPPNQSKGGGSSSYLLLLLFLVMRRYYLLPLFVKPLYVKVQKCKSF